MNAAARPPVVPVSRVSKAPRPGPVGTVFLASGAAALAVVVTNVTLLAARVRVAPVRELDLFTSILGRPGWPRSQLSGRFFAWALPAILSKPLELRSASHLLLFVALAMAGTLLVFWVVAALIVAVVMIAVRAIPAKAAPSFTGWFWEAAYPLLVLVGFSLPAIQSVLADVLPNAGSLTRSGVGIVIGIIVWLGLLGALRPPARIRRFLGLGFAASLIMALATWSGAAAVVAVANRHSQPPAPHGLPNILLVSIDSLRRDHVHCYGYPHETSPAIDGLAREGVQFRTVVSPTSWTLPAHLTLLTSLPPEKHGVVDDNTRLREEALFLSEVLWQAGYTTAGFVSTPYLSAAYGFAQGWDHYDDYTVANPSHLGAWHGTTSPQLYSIVSQWLTRWDGNGRERPFFIFLHMWDVHYDYTPPPPYNTMFDPEYRGTVTGDNFESGTQVHKGMDPRDLRHVIALYDGEIRFTDLYLGQVIDRLRTLGVLDNTVVVVTADHGDEFFEHGRKGHKQALYDETILVPLVIRFPGKVPAGRVVEPQVRLMDVAPTIIALAGVHRQPEFGAAGPTGLDAPQDLTPWIAGDAATTLPALPAFSDLVGEAPVPIASVRTDTRKFIKETRDSDQKEELYDLVADPGEQVNLIGTPGVADTPLRQELTVWRTACRGSGLLSQKAELSEDLKERLRALGYMK